jgi:transcriptional regulator with XRE-family HTH domain
MILYLLRNYNAHLKNMQVKGKLKMEKLTTWLKNKRIKSKLDVRELSLQSFVAISQISRIENNLSDITVSTLVGLGYGLDFGLNDVLNELKISPYFPKLKNKKQPSALIPKVEDAYSIWLLFRDEVQKAKGLMYDGYYQVQNTMGDENANEEPQSFDRVWEALQADSDVFAPLTYPAGLDLSHFAEIYSRGGAITNSDLGICLAQKRLELGLSQRELAKKTEISNSVISRLESGSIERVHFEYAIRIDKALKMDGELLALAWESGEYESGISLLKYINEKSVVQQKLYYTEWEQTAKAWADAFITICRWHYVKGISPLWWDTVQREIAFYKK